MSFVIKKEVFSRPHNNVINHHPKLPLALSSVNRICQIAFPRHPGWEQVDIISMRYIQINAYTFSTFAPFPSNVRQQDPFSTQASFGHFPLPWDATHSLWRGLKTSQFKLNLICFSYPKANRLSIPITFTHVSFSSQHLLNIYLIFDFNLKITFS